MTKQTYVKVGGVWKPCTSIWTRAGGVWKQDVMPLARVGGVYRECMSYRNLIGVSMIAYGKLYEWDAVNLQLLPIGWSVPSNAQVSSFLSYINTIRGGVAQAQALRHRRNVHADAIFTTSAHPRWNSHSARYGRDLVFFGALPGGERYNTGGYEGQGSRFSFWTSTEVDSLNATNYTASNFSDWITSVNRVKNTSLSLRFIRDLTSSESSLPDGTHCGQIQDFNGNIYDTVKIGDFVWTVQNFCGRHTITGSSITNRSIGMDNFSSEAESIWNPAHEHYEFNF